MSVKNLPTLPGSNKQSKSRNIKSNSYDLHTIDPVYSFMVLLCQLNHGV